MSAPCVFPMRGTVLLTRPLAESRELAAALEAAGWRSFIEPMLTIENLAPVLPPLDHYDGLVFTSARGIAAFAPLTARRDRPVFTVGARTARAALESGFEKVVTGPGNAADLAQSIPAGLKLLHPCGRDVAGAALPATRLVVYRARMADSLSAACRTRLAEGGFTAAMFFSARAGRAFARLAAGPETLQTLHSIKVLCLSNRVLESVRSLPWAAAEVAASPGSGAMIALLDEA